MYSLAILLIIPLALFYSGVLTKYLVNDIRHWVSTPVIMMITGAIVFIMAVVGMWTTGNMLDGKKMRRSQPPHYQQITEPLYRKIDHS